MTKNTKSKKNTKPAKTTKKGKTESKTKKISAARKRSNANLKMFKKGQSGNPNGRPLGKRNWDTQVKMAIEFMSQQAAKKGLIEEGEQLDVATEVVAQFFNMARNGDKKMIELFLDRMYGKVTQDITVGGNGNPIENIVIDVETTDQIQELRKRWRKVETKAIAAPKKEPKKKAVKKIKFK